MYTYVYFDSVCPPVVDRVGSDSDALGPAMTAHDTAGYRLEDAFNFRLCVGNADFTLRHPPVQALDEGNRVSV